MTRPHVPPMLRRRGYATGVEYNEDWWRSADKHALNGGELSRADRTGRRMDGWHAIASTDCPAYNTAGAAIIDGRGGTQSPNILVGGTQR